MLPTAFALALTYAYQFPPLVGHVANTPSSFNILLKCHLFYEGYLDFTIYL